MSMTKDYLSDNIDKMRYDAEKEHYEVQTSIEAFNSVKNNIGNLQRTVLDVIIIHSPVTDERIAEISGLNPSTARPRRIELLRLGLIEEAGIEYSKAHRLSKTWRARELI